MQVPPNYNSALFWSITPVFLVVFFFSFWGQHDGAVVRSTTIHHHQLLPQSKNMFKCSVAVIKSTLLHFQLCHPPLTPKSEVLHPQYDRLKTPVVWCRKKMSASYQQRAKGHQTLTNRLGCRRDWNDWNERSLTNEHHLTQSHPQVDWRRR